MSTAMALLRTRTWRRLFLLALDSNANAANAGSSLITPQWQRCLSSSSSSARAETEPEAVPAPSASSGFGYSGDHRLVRSSASALAQRSATRLQAFSQQLDAQSLLNVFADWMTSRKWPDIKELFELWLGALDASGRPNKPNVQLYNHYLRANLMLDEPATVLLDLVADMHQLGVSPNTASYNLVLKAMVKSLEIDAAVKLIDRMIQTGQEAPPDEESFDIVINLLFQENEIEMALKYLDLALKSASYTISSNVFTSCIITCIKAQRLDTTASIIERCKSMDQNKFVCPPWTLCTHLADVAIANDHSKLAFYALEFLAWWMVRAKTTRPPVLLQVDEGLTVAAIGTSARTFSAPLLKASWAILARSLPKKRLPSPEAYLAKIHAFSALAELKWAFRSLHELESAYGNSETEEYRELFSPFTSLSPLVRVCSKGGFATLDGVYFQLDNLSKADPPYKSVAALNCIILGCSNIWDLDRAFQTFEAIQKSFDLTPDVHSYNVMMHAFGRMKQTLEASNVFNHMINVGVKPTEKSYSLLIDAYVINRDVISAVAAVHDMMDAGYSPSKETLRKVKRRCVREFDKERGDLVDSLCRKLNYQFVGENRRDTLFSLNYSTPLV